MIVTRFAAILNAGRPAFWPDDKNPSPIGKRLVWLIAISLLFAMVLPGIVAACNRGFTADKLTQKILGRSDSTNATIAVNKLNQFNADNSNYLAKSEELVSNYFLIAKIDVTNSLSKENIERFKFIGEQLKRSRPHVTMVPFYPYLITQTNGNAPVWFFCFATLFFVMRPHLVPEFEWFALVNLRGRLHQSVCLFFFALFIQVFYFFNIWFRNFFNWNDNRTLYAYCNLDVSPGSFLMAQVVDSATIVLVMLVWLKYCRIYSDICQEYKARRTTENEFAYATNPKTVTGLAAAYLDWQIASVLIGIPCLTQTFFYYQLIFKDGDNRYMPQAINCQILWLVTWMLVSLPLITRYHFWALAKMEALLKGEKNGEEQEKNFAGQLKLRTRIFKNIKPFSAVNLILSALLSALSFLLPLLQGLGK